MQLIRYIEVLKYGWEHSNDVAKEQTCTKSRIAIYIDIIYCYIKYRLWSNQYKKEKFYNLSKTDRDRIGKEYCSKNKKMDLWYDDWYENNKFISKYAQHTYEDSIVKRKQRVKAYVERYNIGKNPFIEFGVIFGRQHYSFSDITVGDNVHFGKNVDIDYTGGLIIENGVSIMDEVKVLTHNHNFIEATKNRNTTYTPLKIEENAIIGTRTTIMPGVKLIGKNSIISACSMVNISVPENAIVAGNPAKIIGYRKVDSASPQIPSINNTDIQTTSIEEGTPVDRVLSILKKCTGANILNGDVNTPFDAIEGWSSLVNMMFIAELEKEFSVTFSSDDMFEMTTPQSVINIISKANLNIVPNDCFENISNLYPHSLLWSNICKHVEMNPSKIAIKIGSNKVSYSDLYRNVCKASSLLRQLGLKHGDCIILSAHKEIEYIYLYFASHILGLTNVIVDAESNEERLYYIENKTNPKYCFGYRSKVFPSKSFEELNIERFEMLQQSPEFSMFSDQDVAEILFTTGTTGAPKGVCLSFANIYGSASNINEFIQNTTDDIELLGLPICHSFGMGRIRCNLLKGATIVVLGNFGNVQQMFKTIADEKVTGFGVVPAAWAYIRKVSGNRISQFANQIKYIEIGSAAMPEDTKKELLEFFPNSRICMHYGLTEASRNCFIEFHDNKHLDSIGLPVCDKVDVKIFDTDGNVMPDGEKGEICVKGNMVMLRYLEEKDMESAFFGEYFRTGDCGFKNRDGFIYLLGREKELINVGGKKVSPMEVEDAVMSLGVGDCMCVPMKDPEGIMGELVLCYILKGSTSLTFEQIAEGLSHKIELYKRPAKYEWIDNIPQTSSGKKQRIAIR